MSTTQSVGRSWLNRLADAETPTTLYHATTPKKLARYRATGTILPPVRGFDNEHAAREWGRIHNRSVVVACRTSAAAYPLPDHHTSLGLAWWTAGISSFEVIQQRERP